MFTKDKKQDPKLAFLEVDLIWWVWSATSAAQAGSLRLMGGSVQVDSAVGPMGPGVSRGQFTALSTLS